MDERRFDMLSRQVGALALPQLPRRGMVQLLSGSALAGLLGILPEPDTEAKKKKCKKEGKKCNKKKCKKQNKKCCCKNLKCKGGVCEGKGPQCPTEVDFVDDFGGSGSGQGDFNDPFGIAIDQDGFLYVTDTGNTRVQIFNRNGNFEDEFGESGDNDDDFLEPLGIGVNENSDGDLRIIVADPGQSTTSRRLRRFDADGDHISNIGRSALVRPVGVATDADDNIWAVDANDGEIFLYDEDGDFRTSWTPSGSGDLNNPQGIAVFEDDNQNTTFVYVADTGHNRVVKFEYTGGTSSSALQFVDSAGSGGGDSDEFNQPVGIAVDKCGNVWVADQFNNRIQQLDKNLNFEQRVNHSSLNRPVGVAVNTDDDRLYVVNNNGNTVSIFDLSS